MNRPVRSRTQGGVGRAGEKLALTRFTFRYSLTFKQCAVTQPTNFKYFNCSRADLIMPLTFNVVLLINNALQTECKSLAKLTVYNLKPFQVVKCLILLALLPHTQPFQPMKRSETARKGYTITYHKRLRPNKTKQQSLNEF
jgi:hypothetical protein